MQLPLGSPLIHSLHEQNRQITARYIRMLVGWAGLLFSPEPTYSQEPYWEAVEHLSTLCTEVRQADFLVGTLPRQSRLESVFVAIDFGENERVYRQAIQRCIALVSEIMTQQSSYDLSDRRYKPLDSWIAKLAQYARESDRSQAEVLTQRRFEFLYFFLGKERADIIRFGDTRELPQLPV